MHGQSFAYGNVQKKASVETPAGLVLRYFVLIDCQQYTKIRPRRPAYQYNWDHANKIGGVETPPPLNLCRTEADQKIRLKALFSQFRRLGAQMIVGRGVSCDRFTLAR